MPLPRPEGHRGEARRGLCCATKPVCVLARPSSEGDPGWQGLPREPREPLCSNRLRRFAGEAESHSKVPQCNQIRHWPHSADTGLATTSTTPPTAAHPLVTTAHWQLRNERQGIQARQRRQRNRAALRPGIVLLPADHPSPSSRPRGTRPVQAQPFRHSRSIPITPDHSPPRQRRHSTHGHTRPHVATTRCAQPQQPPRHSTHNPISHPSAHTSIRSAHHATITAPPPPNRAVGGGVVPVDRAHGRNTRFPWLQCEHVCDPGLGCRRVGPDDGRMR